MDYIKFIGEKINKKWVKSFKQLGNNAVSMTKYDYMIKILPDIQNFYVTDKIEGLRCFLIINPKEAKYITSDFVKDVKEYVNLEEVSGEYVYDCELVKKNNVIIKIYIFDIILSNGENVSSMPFKNRIDFVRKSPFLNQNIMVKEFIPLTISTYQNTIMKLYNSLKSRPYETDGMIFTSINDNYNKTMSYKWKPPAKLTIDFFVIDWNQDQYMLLVGISQKMYKRFGVNLSQEEISKIEKIPGAKFTNDYFPIPFKNSLASNYIILKSSMKKFTKEPLVGKIVEMSYENNEWKFYKIRKDREKDLLSGSYYGNNYKTAETTLQSILNPITLKDLVSNYHDLSKSFYFQKKSDDEFKFIKKFNNFVKRSLIIRNKSENVIDLASGRGGDLNHYFLAGVKNLLMLEININSIDEIINRKYDILLGKNEGSLNLLVENMDLNEPYKNNIQKLQKRNIEFLNYPKINVFCHFAFHYLVENENMTKNICEFLNNYLKPGSNFIITILDGQKVFELIKKTGEWKTNKYLIKSEKLGKVFSGFGNKIKIKLPFSNEVYDEFLVDLLSIDKIFSKYGIFRTEERTFDKLFNEFSIYNQYFYSNLDEDDKMFAGLYKYVIYTKK